MRKRIVVVVPAAAAAAALVLGPGAAQASTGSAAPSVPPVCVKVPLPNPFVSGAQLQVGYCPQ